MAMRAVRIQREKVLTNTYSNCAMIDYLVSQRKFVKKENEEELNMMET